ncbi:lysozyme [Caldicellulosiruptor acetigenus]|uniref:lysozyme n=2 Tax=Caldicellulosiruptor acetigenus TaxID=301953 RepID=UPI0012EBC1C0|nr:lysozyme [Caldicellulosiruptor acetigenus]
MRKMKSSVLTSNNLNLTLKNNSYLQNLSAQKSTAEQVSKSYFSPSKQNTAQNNSKISPAYVYEKGSSANELYGKIVYERPSSNSESSTTKINAVYESQNTSTKIKRLEPSKALFEFVKSYEGYSSIAYRDKDGVWTIGIGHVLRGKELEEYVGLKTNSPKKAITEEKAYEFFKSDIKNATDAVNKFMENNKIQLPQNQFDALVSFTFNVGPAWTTDEKSKIQADIVKAIKSGIDIKLEKELRDDFLAWSKAQGKVLEGLQRRRYDEWEMFVKGDYKVTDINTWKKIKKEMGL